MEDLKNYLNTIRRDFSGKELSKESVPNDPLELYNIWFEEAVQSQILDPYAMMVSTVNTLGRPSSRVVYLRDVVDGKLVFYTNYKSKKGAELHENKGVSALFYWAELSRQIRFEGSISKAPKEMSDKYFASRPRESQIGAWASQQSDPLKNRGDLERSVEEFTKNFEGQEVPRPSHWGGYLIDIDYAEFWQGRPSRLHDRIVFEKHNNNWEILRLNP